MSSKTKRVAALRSFIKDYFALITKENIDKEAIKEAKKTYFGVKLKFKYRIPTDDEIAQILMEYLIKRDGLTTQDAVQLKIERMPFLNLASIHAEDFAGLINQVAKSNEFADRTEGMSDAERIDHLKQAAIQQHKQEIKDNLIDLQKQMEKSLRETTEVGESRIAELDKEIRQREEMLMFLPSVLDGVDFEEPVDELRDLTAKQWWEQLGLRSNPFPALQGFLKIDREMYDLIAVETEPILQMLTKLKNNDHSFFHKGHLVAGEFGSGKTTFFDFLAPHLAMNHIEPLFIDLAENISVAHYIQAYKKRLCIRVANLARHFNIEDSETTGARIMDYELAQVVMLELQEQKKVHGYFIFFDELHKHTQRDIVMSFLSNMQQVKDSMTRDGINTTFFVAGLPDWEPRIRRDSALTGFFDSGDIWRMPAATPELAAQVINKRLEAFSLNTQNSRPVRREFLELIFRKTSSELGGVNIGFRPYIQAAIDKLSAGELDILDAGFETSLQPDVLQAIKQQIVQDAILKTRFDKLIFGGKIEKTTSRMRTLKVLCTVYIRNGISEVDSLFKENVFSFKRLMESGLIQRVNHNGALLWRICKELDRMNTKLNDSFRVSLEDYLVPIYSVVSSSKQGPTTQSKATRIAADLGDWMHSIDRNIGVGLNYAFRQYRNFIEPYTMGTRQGFSRTEAPEAEMKLRKSIDSLMRSIISFESPSLLDVCPDEIKKSWDLRHRPLESPQNFANLKFSSEEHASLADIGRFIRFASETFEELWDEFRHAKRIYEAATVRCYQLPRQIVKKIYEDFDGLHSFSSDRAEYFKVFGNFIKLTEDMFRTYLHVSALLIFGPYHTRIKHYPEEIRRYITGDAMGSRYGYECYNEFENMNRGQYRSLFTSQNKTAPFFRYIIHPVIQKWDSHDVTAFFSLFGDMNIVSSHSKLSSIEDLKADIPTFFRLACRIVSSMSDRLVDLLLSNNIYYEGTDRYQITFGYKPKESLPTNRRVTSEQEKDIPNEIYKHEILFKDFEAACNEIMEHSDNFLGIPEFDLIDIATIRIKYSMDFCKCSSLISMMIANGRIRAILPYGTTVYLKNVMKT
jgi:hypothetical protein